MKFAAKSQNIEQKVKFICSSLHTVHINDKDYKHIFILFYLHCVLLRRTINQTCVLKGLTKQTNVSLCLFMLSRSFKNAQKAAQAPLF